MRDYTGRARRWWRRASPPAKATVILAGATLAGAVLTAATWVVWRLR